MAKLQSKLQIVLDLDPAGAVKGAKLVSSNLNNVSKSAGHASSKADGLKRSLSSMWRITGGILLFNIIRKITRAIEGLIKVGIDFEAQMANVNSVVQTDTEGLQKLTDAVIDLSLDPRIKDGPQKLAEGLYTVTSAGYSSADSLIILKEAAYGATAGVSDTKTATDVLIGTLGAFNLKASDSASTMDKIFEIIAISKYTFNDLASSLATVTPTAAAMGVTFDEVGAAIATMGFKGIDANHATVNLNAILSGLLKPTDDLTEAMQSLGYENGLQMIQALGFTGTLKALYNLVGGNKQKLTDMFGNVRAERGIFSLVNDAGAEYNKMLDKMGDSAGATERALDKQVQSSAFQIAVLKKNIQILAVLGFGLIAPYLAKAFGTVNGLLSGMLVSFRHFRTKGYGFFEALRAGMKTAFGDMFGPAAAMKAAHFVDKLEDFFYQLKSVVETVGPPFMALMGFMYDHFNILGPAILGAVVALKAFSVIMAISNTIMAIMAFELTPLIVVLVLIAAAGALFAVAWSKNWFHTREHTASAVKFIGKWLGKFWDFIHPVIDQIKILGQYWSDIVHHRIEPGNLPKVAAWMLPIVIITGRVVKSLRVFFKTWQDKGFLAALRTIPAQVRAFGRAIANVLDSFGLHHFADNIRVVFNDMSKVIGDVINLVDDIIHGRWDKVWKDFVKLAQDGVKMTLARLMLIPSLIYDILVAIPWGTVGHAMRIAGQYMIHQIWKGIKSLAGWIWRQIKIGFGQIYDQLIWYFRGFYAAGRILLSWIWTGIASLLGWIWTQMSKIPVYLMSAITWYAMGFYNAGRDVVSGLWRGISSLGGWLWDQVKAFVEHNILGAISFGLVTGSPSKAAAEKGRTVPQGLAMGIDKDAHLVHTASIGLARLAINGLSTGGFQNRRSSIPTVNPMSLNGGRPAGEGFMSALSNNRSLNISAGAITVNDSSDPRKTARVILSEIRRQEAGMH